MRLILLSCVFFGFNHHYIGQMFAADTSKFFAVKRPIKPKNTVRIKSCQSSFFAVEWLQNNSARIAVADIKRQGFAIACPTQSANRHKVENFYWFAAFKWANKCF